MTLPALALLALAVAAPTEPSGSLRGQVVDARTQTPLSSVTVSLPDTTFTASTDERGAFVISDVPVGSYNVVFRHAGHSDLLRTDVSVRSTRPTFVNVEMGVPVNRHEDVTVTDYFQETERTSAVTHMLGGEELRRTAPGGDLSRALYAVPGVVQSEDSANDLVVRGGSPAENGYYIDNIPVPNINHFPQEGASGGAISMLNIAFVEDVQVLTGGFGAEYGNRLSSVVDIKYREGSRAGLAGQLDLNMTGLGGSFEGPLPKGKGSWMISAKRSYLDILSNMLGSNMDVRYNDVQGKLVYDLSSRHRLTVLAIHGQSQTQRDEAQAVAQGDTEGSEHYVQNTFGVNWRALWGEHGYSNTSLSYAFINGDSQWHQPFSPDPPWRSRYHDGAYSLRNVNRVQISQTQRLEFGVDGSLRSQRALNAATNQDLALTSWDAAAFANCTLSRKLTASLGLRSDRDPYGRRIHLAPRASLSYAPTQRLTFSAAYGLYNQNLPLALVLQSPANKDLSQLQATHYVLGAAYHLRPDTRVTLELYDKAYRHFPLAPDMPQRFVIDDVTGTDRTFWTYKSLVDTGVAYSRGVELMLQKKLSGSFYGVLSGSLFRSRYRDLAGAWHSRTHDNRYVANVIGGYRPSKYWEMTARWVFAGGAATTPYQVWTWPGGATANLDWNNWNGTHLPNYSTLGLRIDRRFYFRKTTLATYFAVWNAYDRKNVRYYYWNWKESRLDASYQWARFPFLGVEFAF